MTTGTPTLNELPHFTDRLDAGRQLAARLKSFERPSLVVVGIAPEGMPVAAEVARLLNAPLQAIAIESLNIDGDPSRVFGTAAEGGITLFDRSHLDNVDTRSEAVDAAIARAQQRIAERTDRWWRGIGRPSLHRRHVLLVDDVLENNEDGAAAACCVRDRGAAGVTCAAPLVRLGAAAGLIDWAEEVYCLGTLAIDTPVTSCFSSFEAVSDEEVRRLLRENMSTKGPRR